MPCTDPRDNECISSGNEHLKFATSKINSLEHDLSQYKGAMCALMNELSRRDLLVDVVTHAEINGDVDISTLWIQHVEDDEFRVGKKLNDTFSQDEQFILRKLLNVKTPIVNLTIKKA